MGIARLEGCRHPKEGNFSLGIWEQGFVNFRLANAPPTVTAFAAKLQTSLQGLPPGEFAAIHSKDVPHEVNWFAIVQGVGGNELGLVKQTFGGGLLRVFEGGCGVTAEEAAAEVDS
jgi:hypothetical protein